MLNEAIKSILGNDATLQSLVGDRIYPLLTPENGQYPSISYFHVDEPHENEIATGRAGLATPRIQIDAWSNDFDEVWAVSQAIFNALDSFRGTVAGVEIVGALCIDRRDFYEQESKTFHVATDFQISHHE